jgi:hypothetical protein
MPDASADADPDPRAFDLALGTPQPTQYCLSAAKLRGVLDWFDVDDPEYEPLPVARLPAADADAEHRGVEGGAVDDGDAEAEWLLLDGHTRAVCALLAGERSLSVRDATADDDVDLDVYLTCRDWCRERGVHSVRDLVGETWSADRYAAEWLERCERELGSG